MRTWAAEAGSGRGGGGGGRRGGLVPSCRVVSCRVASSRARGGQTSARPAARGFPRFFPRVFFFFDVRLSLLLRRVVAGVVWAGDRSPSRLAVVYLYRREGGIEAYGFHFEGSSTCGFKYFLILKKYYINYGLRRMELISALKKLKPIII